MKHKKFITVILSLAFCTVFFCGCPAEIKITPNKDGTFSTEFNSALGENLLQALNDLSEVSSRLSEEKVDFNLSQMLNTEQIEKELNCCFDSAKVKIQNNNSIIANAKTKKNLKAVKELLSQEKTKGGTTKVTLTLSPEVLQKTLLKDETNLKTFAAVLMAPLITGETMSAIEYKDLLNELYGEKVSQELLSQNLTITLVNPNGKNLSQKIPILDLLIITKPYNFVFEY